MIYFETAAAKRNAKSKAHKRIRSPTHNLAWGTSHSTARFSGSRSHNSQLTNKLAVKTGIYKPAKSSSYPSRDPDKCPSSSTHVPFSSADFRANKRKVNHQRTPALHSLRAPDHSGIRLFQSLPSGTASISGAYPKALSKP